MKKNIPEEILEKQKEKHVKRIEEEKKKKKVGVVILNARNYINKNNKCNCDLSGQTGENHIVYD